MTTFKEAFKQIKNYKEGGREMKVRIKKLHPDAVIPQYATQDSAGMDLTVVSWEIDEHGNKVYHTGLAFEIPKGYVGLVFPRSSNTKKNLLLTNSVGVIDADYRGEVTMKFKSGLRVVSSWKTMLKLYLRHFIGKEDAVGVTNIWDNEDYQVGDRCGQMIIMPYPRVEFEQVEELTQTERGEGGHGSTGK